MTTSFSLTDISILLTQKCDKGCKFCCVDARQSFENHLSFDHLLKLRSGLLNSGIRPNRIALTGGEAFLYQSQRRNIIDVFDLLQDLPLDHISVQTSGWSEEMPEFEGHVIQLARRSYTNRIRFSSSYNLYQRLGIEHRMIKTIDLITTHFKYIHLQNAIDPQNLTKTAESFYRVMSDLGFQGPSPTKISEFLTHKYWIHHSEERCVVSHFYPAYRVGRGKRTIKNVFVKERQGCPVAENDKNWLTIEWDGSVKICNSIAAWVTNPKFGHLDEDFVELLKRHSEEMRFVKNEVLAKPWDELASAGYESLCQYCAEARSKKPSAGVWKLDRQLPVITAPVI